ncbi:MAG: tail fiber domain-containing protein, partial [Cryomorphaceae bacterium]
MALLIVLLCQQESIAQSMSINSDGAKPDTSAMLDVSSSNRGMLIPRMTLTQLIAISNPADGLMVYQTDGNKGLYTYNGTAGAWMHLLDSTSVANLIFSLTDSSRISDADGNTKVQVEESTNEDIIRFDIGGTEMFRMHDRRIDFVNTGGSVYLGENAGNNDNAGSNLNVAIGDRAMESNTGTNNVAIGRYAARIGGNVFGNVAIGESALYSNSTGTGNTAVGWRAGILNTASNNNTLIGTNANYYGNGGNNNTMVGFETGYGSAPHSKSGNIFIGYRAGYNETGSNKLYIENSASSTPLIYGDFSGDSVKINGTLITTGNVGIGTTSPISQLELLNTATNTTLTLTNQNTTSSPIVNFRRSRTGQSAVANNDFLGIIQFSGYTGSSHENGARIRAQVEGATGTGDLPTRLLFETSADGTSSPIARMTITNAGDVGIGTTSPGNKLTVLTANTTTAGTAALQFGDATGSAFLGSGSTYTALWDDGGIARLSVLQSNGNVGINTISPSYTLDVNGAARVSSLRVNTTNLQYGATMEVDSRMNIIGSSNPNLFIGPSGTNYLQIMYNTGSNYAQIFTPGSRDILLSPGGNLGVGTTNPIRKLDVVDNGNYVARFENTQTGITSGILALVSGATLPGAANSFAIFVNGTNTIIGGITGNGVGGVLYNTTSDRRLKRDIQPMENALEMVNALKPRSYERIQNPGNREFGF